VATKCPGVGRQRIAQIEPPGKKSVHGNQASRPKRFQQGNACRRDHPARNEFTEGREILSFIEGNTPEFPNRGWRFRSAPALGAIARMVRAFHDAVEGFVPPADAKWRGIVGSPGGNEVICHNDLGPFNTVFRRAVPVAIIDWDNAAPGRRLWDIACALWRFAPLWRRDAWWGGDRAGNGWSQPLEVRAERMAVFSESYGREHFPNWRTVLDMIEARMHASELTINARARDRLPGYEKFANGFALTDLSWLRQNRAELERLLRTRASVGSPG